MQRMMMIVVVCVAAVSCGGGSGSNPLNPSDNDTGKLHLSVDGATCRGIGPVNVNIDGTGIGTVNPGDNGITRDVALGTHHVSATAVHYYIYWGPYTVTVPEAGYSFLFYCK